MIPTCPICDARDADHLPEPHPWGKPWYCRHCEFVYLGSDEERKHWETRQQRLRHRNTRQAQWRNWAIGASRMNERSAEVSAERLKPREEQQ